ncbi:MAG: Asp-tRNA(Asn)/Glu-tRNA(Gln) amidotransferase subunit GatB [Oscillospiraceae bacterium]|nr:Asp-tRNA(Asn)/Glu-tRNA(Gln) amidotransferase subunit GatB [Oscillospiraceae bacterium]
MKWEIVMGLEVHAELSTKTKIFCGCSTEFGGEPNTHVCPGCAGMPGTLPKFNRQVLEYAVRLGLTLGCDIAKRCTFDRKNYYYPDLPKAYQVSQLYAPICRNGGLTIVGEWGEKFIRLHQIHMEEDAGKLVHSAGNVTLMDFNRGSTPLLEIVSEPDFRSAAEVIAYLEKLRETLMYLDVCDCKMQEGSLRADVNLSVRPAGEEKLGVRVEMKNINSFKAIARAIAYESERQIDVIESGGTLIQETRRWDDDKGESYGMRSKANAADYRYFPDPDLPPIVLGDDELARIRATLPEMADKKRERYIADGVSAKVAASITAHKNVSDLFEDIVRHSGNTKESANLISGEVMRLLKGDDADIEQLDVQDGQLGRKLGELVKLVADGKINRNAYKEVVGVVFADDGIEPMRYIEEKGLLMVEDSGAAREAVAAILKDNESAVEDYRAGKQKAFGFLMGQAMKKLGGTASPDVIKSTLTEMLEG